METENQRTRDKQKKIINLINHARDGNSLYMEELPQHMRHLDDSRFVSLNSAVRAPLELATLFFYIYRRSLE